MHEIFLDCQERRWREVLGSVAGFCSLGGRSGGGWIARWIRI